MGVDLTVVHGVQKVYYIHIYIYIYVWYSTALCISYGWPWLYPDPSELNGAMGPPCLAQNPRCPGWSPRRFAAWNRRRCTWGFMLKFEWCLRKEWFQNEGHPPFLLWDPKSCRYIRLCALHQNKQLKASKFDDLKTMFHRPFLSNLHWCQDRNHEKSDGSYSTFKFILTAVEVQDALRLGFGCDVVPVFGRYSVYPASAVKTLSLETAAEAVVSAVSVGRLFDAACVGVL